LHLGVTGLGLLDESAHGRLVKYLAHRHRFAVVDDVEQRLASGFDLDLGRSDALYGTSLISGNGHDCRSRRSSKKAIAALITASVTTRSSLRRPRWKASPRLSSSKAQSRPSIRSDSSRSRTRAKRSCWADKFCT